MHTRHAAVAGQFYPYDVRQLGHMVDDYLAAASVDAAPERVAALVVPHAGYVYSGPTAAYGYARVRGKTPDRVILLGVSHRYGINGAAIFREGEFETPLGAFPVDDVFCDILAETLGEHAASGPLTEIPHQDEHTLEVQLPFLWRAIGQRPIVPVLFGTAAGAFHKEFGERLAAITGPNDLVVASTDLSHYLSQDKANEIDRRSVALVLGQDVEAFARALAANRASMCGGAAVAAAMAYARAAGAMEWQLLDYRTSGDTGGDYNRVVGYAAISMERAL